MAAKKRGLGRGLDALLSPGGTPVAGDDGDLRQLAVDLVHRGPFQPRSTIEPRRLEELADSIKAQGVVQPILVRPDGQGRFELIAGERRWRAAQLAGLHEIPAVVKAVPDQAAMAIGLIENIQRENLNPLEEARALKRLVSEFSMTHQGAAEAVGRSRAAVSNLLRLLDLDESVQALLAEEQLEMGHGRALLGLEGSVQREAARRVVDRGLSVRDTERLVKRLARGQGRQRPPPAHKDPDVRRLEQRLSESLGAAVEIRHKAGGAGQLILRYDSLAQLDGILDKLD